MKVIFVGIHNKAGLKPLCSSTRSGKLLDRVIERLPKDVEVLKTNLYNVEYCPKKRGEKQYYARDWHKRNTTESTACHYPDVVVLLGGETHKWFIDTGLKIVKLAHPSRIPSDAKKEAYVARSRDAIGQALKETECHCSHGLGWAAESCPIHGMGVPQEEGITPKCCNIPMKYEKVVFGCIKCHNYVTKQWWEENPDQDLLDKEFSNINKPQQSVDVPRVLTDFFIYWWNSKGNNTPEAANTWWNENKQKYQLSQEKNQHVHDWKLIAPFQGKNVYQCSDSECNKGIWGDTIEQALNL